MESSCCGLHWGSPWAASGSDFWCVYFFPSICSERKCYPLVNLVPTKFKSKLSYGSSCQIAVYSFSVMSKNVLEKETQTVDANRTPWLSYRQDSFSEIINNASDRLCRLLAEFVSNIQSSLELANTNNTDHDASPATEIRELSCAAWSTSFSQSIQPPPPLYVPYCSQSIPAVGG